MGKNARFFGVGHRRCILGFNWNDVRKQIPAVKNLIREDKIYQIPSLVQQSSHEGMQTLDQDLQRLVSQGVISRDKALEIADDPEKFDKGIY